MGQRLVVVGVGTLSGAAVFWITAEIIFRLGECMSIVEGFLFGLPLGSLVDIAVVDRFVCRVERPGIAARILGTILSFILSCGVAFATAALFFSLRLIRTSSPERDSLTTLLLAVGSASITASCACIFGRWIAGYRRSKSCTV